MVVKILPKLKSCGLIQDNPEVFAMSQWQNTGKSVYYLIYRWMFALFFLFVLTYSITSSINSGSIGYWFIYLTNIGLFICTLFAVYGASFVSLYYFEILNLETRSFSYKIFWLLSNISIVLAFLISIIYWTTLYDWSSGKTTLLDLLIHGLNSVLMLMDLLVVRHPIFFFHVIYTIGVGLIYLLFSVIYYFAGGRDMWGNNYIYSILNWNQAAQTIGIIFGVIILTIFLHCIVCIIQLGRMRMHKLIKISKENSFEVNT